MKIENIEIKGKITIRNFLKLGGIVLTGTILSTIDREQIEDRVGEILTAPEFDPFPKGFDFAASHEHFVTVVHAGHAHSHSGINPSERSYGSYETYLNNLKGLNKYLGNQKNDLTAFAVKNSVYQEQEQYYLEDLEGLSPPNSALTIVTFSQDGKPKEYINTPDGLREQKISKIFSFVERTGISEVEFAGEWAWYEGDGCLTDMARLFKNQGFRVRGIEGCIYPSKPPENLSDEIFKDLYVEPIKFPLSS